MERWQEDYEWGRGFIPHLRHIFGFALIREAPIEQDIHENTDLVFLLGEARRIAIRIRRLEFMAPFNRRNEWTIRYRRHSGVETELAKLLYGWGDYYFYGWGDERDWRIKVYTLIDLKPARPWVFTQALRLLSERPHGQVQSNKDTSSDFVAFALDDMPPEAILLRERGLTQEPRTPSLDRLRQLWRQTTPEQHEAFLAEILTPAQRYALTYDSIPWHRDVGETDRSTV